MTELRAHCKINLGLRVVRRRADGFHDIETVMMPVRGLFDTVSVKALSDDAVISTASSLEVSGGDVDCPPEQNICMRALRLMQRECGIGEAVIRLHKVIPSGAGLGGGSADAAAVLHALNREFALELSASELERLGADLGSDVPFFVRGGVDSGGSEAGSGGDIGGSVVLSGRAQLCTGRGEVMSAVEVDLAGLWLVVAKPPVAVSTAEAYAGVTPREEALKKHNPREFRDHMIIDESIRRPRPEYRSQENGMSIPEVLHKPVGEWREWLRNDFEESVFACHPEIGAIKRGLYDAGAIYASMSGSGSAVFGIFEQRPKLRFPDSLFVHSERLV